MITSLGVRPSLSVQRKQSAKQSAVFGMSLPAPSGDSIRLSGSRVKFGHGASNITFPKFAPPPFNAAFHADRREQFLAKLPANTTVIIPGGTTLLRNGDVTHPFRQESNFYYLTGFEEPDALAILSNVPGQPKYTLVVPPRDPAMETWNGKRAGTTGAVSKYGANEAFDNTDLGKALKKAFGSTRNIQFVPAEANNAMNRKLRTIFTKARLNPEDASSALYELRLRKTPYELALLKRACDITAIGHIQAMKNMQLSQADLPQGPGPWPFPTSNNHRVEDDRAQGRNEGEVQAELEYHYRRHGAARVGYETIAGGGANGCVLHYNTNKEYAKPGDLILVDSGAEYGYYTADITRTWPVSGKFTAPQKAIYDIVLKAQEAGIRMIKPGVTMNQIHNECVRIVTQGLMELGILGGNANNPAEVQSHMKAGAHRKYFMHGTSHMLGLDVHDVPLKSTVIDGVPTRNSSIKDRPLEAGMFLTVEPGIYIDPEVAKAEGLDPKWGGIGVRIEDDILVTQNGYENFSAAIPRTTDEIEALMAQGKAKLD